MFTHQIFAKLPGLSGISHYGLFTSSAINFLEDKTELLNFTTCPPHHSRATQVPTEAPECRPPKGPLVSTILHDRSLSESGRVSWERKHVNSTNSLFLSHVLTLACTKIKRLTIQRGSGEWTLLSRVLLKLLSSYHELNWAFPEI